MKNTHAQVVLIGDRHGPLEAINECLKRTGVVADLIDPGDRPSIASPTRSYQEALIEAEYSIRVLQEPQAVSSVTVKRDVVITDAAEVFRLIQLLQEFLPGAPRPSFLYKHASLGLFRALGGVSSRFLPASESPESIVADWLRAAPAAESPMQASLFRDALAGAFAQIQHRLSSQPFGCELLACGYRSERDELDIVAGEIPPEIRAQEQSLREAVILGRPVTFELPLRAQGERRTIGLLPLGDATLILTRVDRPRPEMPDYGLDTYFFHQARLAVEEVLRQRKREAPMKPTNGSIDKPAEPPLAAFEREMAAFRLELPTLLQSRKGWFVAFRQGCRIDEDRDEFALARRVDSKFKSEFVLVTRVGETSDTAVLDSPEF